MLIKGEEGVVEQVAETSASGVPAFDVAVKMEADGRVERATLRADLLPDGLAAGDRVTLTRAALYRRWTIARAGADG